MHKIKYIGMGAAGNKAVVELIKSKVAETADTVLINSTDKDFPTEYEGDKIILSPDNTGCGKERVISKEYALTMLQSGVFDAKVEGYDATVIVTSLEGGTGSGSAPIIGKYCAEVLGKTVRVFGFAGFEDDVRGLQNTVEFFQDINFDCATQCIKNSKFGNGNKFEAEHEANLDFCKQMEILSGKLLIASSQNMDDTDLVKVVNTTGYCISDKVEFDENLVDSGDFDKLCKQLIGRSKALKAENGQLRLGIILNIRPESEDAIDTSFKALKDTYGYPYEEFIHKQYDGKKQYIAFIAAGMKLPLDEVKSVYDKYRAATKAVDKSSDTFFDEIKGMTRDEEDNRFDMVRQNKKGSGNKDAFFKQFAGSSVRKG